MLLAAPIFPPSCIKFTLYIVIYTFTNFMQMHSRLSIFTPIATISPSSHYRQHKFSPIILYMILLYPLYYHCYHTHYYLHYICIMIPISTLELVVEVVQPHYYFYDHYQHYHHLQSLRQLLPPAITTTSANPHDYVPK